MSKIELTDGILTCGDKVFCRYQSMWLDGEFVESDDPIPVVYLGEDDNSLLALKKVREKVAEMSGVHGDDLFNTEVDGLRFTDSTGWFDKSVVHGFGITN